MREEKRHYNRQASHSKVNIQLGGLNINAELENLSLKGAFVTPLCQDRCRLGGAV